MGRDKVRTGSVEGRPGGEGPKEGVGCLGEWMDVLCWAVGLLGLGRCLLGLRRRGKKCSLRAVLGCSVSVRLDEKTEAVVDNRASQMSKPKSKPKNRKKTIF